MSKSKKRSIACEPLEERRMFVTYQVTGTSGPDTISISIDGNNIISAVNGVSDSASDIVNNNIEISALGGNDIISITETGNNTVVVNAGSGDDTINIGNGANNLGVIDDAVTVNGDTGDDDAIFFDNSNSSNVTYTSSLGNRLVSTQMPTATVNAEYVEVKGGSGNSTMTFNDAPFAHWLFHGGLGNGINSVVANGAAGESMTYRTGGTSGGSGSIDWPTTGETTEFFFAPDLYVNDFGSVTMRPSFMHNEFSVTATGTRTTISGVSGVPVVGPPSALHMDDVAVCTLDFGTSPPSNDTVNFNATSPDNTLFRVDLGSGAGTNVININANTKLDTHVGLAGGQFTAINVNNATALFDGLQTPQSLTLKNSATAQFIGSGTVLSVPTLNVPTGDATLRIDSGQTGSVLTSFSIAGGSTLSKSGGGTFNVNATQTHGANSHFDNNGGTTNFNTDCGSTTSRPLDLFSQQGIINVNATQHVDSLGTNFGDINVGANGNRVVVTNFVGVGGEGGIINLNDNDMIVDYTNVADASEVRAALHNGRNNGAWDGNGINSNTAATNPLRNTTLGSLEATEFKSIYGAAATFDGQALDNTMLLIKYTYYGDADFNGVVNFDDYSRIDNGFPNQRTGWLNGDFDDSGSIDFDDYSLIDNAFNTQGNALRPARNPLAPKPTFRDGFART